MRIWRLTDPNDHRFAAGRRIGTWEEKNGESVRVSPLVIEWEKGPTVVGDFVWPGLGDELVVREHVFKVLKRKFGGITAKPVEVVPRKLKRRREDGNLHTWSNRADLVDVQIQTHVNADLDKSTYRIVDREDGGTDYEFEGIEYTEWYNVPRVLLPECRRRPRLPDHGIFVRSRALKGQSFLKVNQCPAWNLCTDRVRDFILAEGFSNVDFMEAGEVFQ